MDPIDLLQALVAAWQMGAISRDTLLHNFRQGEILPPGRTNEQELEKINAEGGGQRSEDRGLQQAAFLQKVAH